MTASSMPKGSCLTDETVLPSSLPSSGGPGPRPARSDRPPQRHDGWPGSERSAKRLRLRRDFEQVASSATRLIRLRLLRPLREGTAISASAQPAPKPMPHDKSSLPTRWDRARPRSLIEPCSMSRRVRHSDGLQARPWPTSIIIPSTAPGKRELPILGLATTSAREYRWLKAAAERGAGSMQRAIVRRKTLLLLSSGLGPIHPHVPRHCDSRGLVRERLRACFPPWEGSPPHQ